MTEMTTGSESPTNPAPTPPGDFANDPFFMSPSTWLAIVGGLAPIITVLLKDNAPAVIEALSGLAPLVAFAVLIIQRNKNHRNVQQLNAGLAQQRISTDAALQVEALAGLIAKTSATTATQVLTTGKTLQFPLLSEAEPPSEPAE